MPQVPTARGIKIRSASDAHLLFYAVHLQRLPIIQRRLDATERLEVTSGAVFVWEERSASTATGAKLEPDAGPAAGVISGIERWTDGLKWGPSRVRDDFLFYQEKDPSGDASISPPPLSHNHPYRKGQAKQPELLIKQTYSVHYNPQILDGKLPVEPARKWHLTAYQSAASVDRLADVSSVPELHEIAPPDGLFRKARIGKKREGPPGAQSATGTTPMMGSSSMYPLEPYESVHNGISGISHGHRNGGHSASGSFDMGVEHGREGSMARSSWREDSASEMGVPHRPLLPQHPSQGLGQNGYSARNGLPSSSPYPPPHNGHAPPSNGYHGSHYVPQSHYTPTHGHTHSTSHHSNSGSIGYGEPQSPYTQAHHNSGNVPGGNYVEGVPVGYSYPHREVGYGHAREGEYNRVPGPHGSPSMAHATPAMNGHLPNPPQHDQSLHHPHPSANGQNTYDSYHPSTTASQQQHQQQQHPVNQNPQHHNDAPIQPPQDGMDHVRQAHHSYSFSNGHPVPDSPHLRQVTPHMQHSGIDSRPYPPTPQQRSIMPHPHYQNSNLDHRRTFSQSSYPVSGALDGMRSPVGVARIRKGTRKSEDIASSHPIMSRSPPSNSIMNGTSAMRSTGTGAIGGNGGRSQFSPYSRPVDTPGPRQHTGIAPHHQNETASTLPSFDDPYNPRGTNGSFPHQDQGAMIHMRSPSNLHSFATPSVPSVPAPPDLHHQYQPPIPPSLPPRTGIPQGPPSTPGYYYPPGAARNGGSMTTGGPSPFGPPDYSRSTSSGTWGEGSASTLLSPLRSTPLQSHSAYPFPAGSLPIPQNISQQPNTDMSSETLVGIPAVPIGTTIQGHIAPHPNPNSSPLLTHFQPMSTSFGSNRSGAGSGGSGRGSNGLPELAGLHQHMAATTGLASAWDGGGGTMRDGTPVPPRIDTSLGGVESSPVSVTAGGSASGSASSKLGPLTPSTTLVTRDAEDERVLDLLSRRLIGAAGVRGGAEGNAGVPAGGLTEEETNAKADE